ncbi:hypothetical protein IKP85_04990 [bacterium]|nr:hypothetical protein [bacterium]
MEKITTVYYYIALFSTTLFVLKMLLFSVFGGDTEVHTDFTSSIETETSFDFISIQSVLGFLMGFGWMGLTCIKVWGLPAFAVALISIAFGLLIMFLASYTMYLVKKLNKRVIKDLSKSVGLIGRAYTNFVPNGEGQIEISFNEQLSIEEAVNTTSEEIKAFDSVKVLKYENNRLYIEKA